MSTKPLPTSSPPLQHRLPFLAAKRTAGENPGEYTNRITTCTQLLLTGIMAGLSAADMVDKVRVSTCDIILL